MKTADWRGLPWHSAQGVWLSLLPFRLLPFSPPVSDSFKHLPPLGRRHLLANSVPHCLPKRFLHVQVKESKFYIFSFICIYLPFFAFVFFPFTFFPRLLPYLTLPPGWTGSYTCPALRLYQLGPMCVPECNQKVTRSGHKVVTAVKP